MNITPGQQNKLNFDCSLSSSVLNYLHGRKINWFDFSEVLNNCCSDFSTILNTFFYGIMPVWIWRYQYRQQSDWPCIFLVFVVNVKAWKDHRDLLCFGTDRKDASTCTYTYVNIGLSLVTMAHFWKISLEFGFSLNLDLLCFRGGRQAATCICQHWVVADGLGLLSQYFKRFFFPPNSDRWKIETKNCWLAAPSYEVKDIEYCKIFPGIERTPH